MCEFKVLGQVAIFINLDCIDLMLFLLKDIKKVLHGSKWGSLLLEQKSQSILVLASTMMSMDVKPQREGMSQEVKTMYNKTPGAKLVVSVVLPFGGCYNLDMRHMGHS
jgi:hypothetical protein